MTPSKPSRLSVAVLMDPIEDVVIGHDTTFAILVELDRRGHDVRVFEQSTLGVREGRGEAAMRRIHVRREAGNHFDVLDRERRFLGDHDVLLMRKDPPVDVEFLHATQIADLLGEGSKTFVMNRPSGLRDANEKLFTFAFADLMPETIVTQDRAVLRRFLEGVGGDMIVKPVDGFGGKGILHVKDSDRNLAVLLDLATSHGKEAVMAQRYLEASREGDKRIILLDGEPIGAVLRVPDEKDTRGNLAVGGRAAAAQLTERDLEICGRLAPALRERGLWFVGLDVIGDYLTEVNVTSPTGVEEIDRLSNVCLEAQIVDFIEARVGETRGI